MDEKSIKLSGKNINQPEIKVKHAELKRLDYSDSPFHSKCPVCEIGVLLVNRDQETLKLLAEDRCILCGQKFIYTDMEALIKMEKPKEIKVLHAHFYGKCAKIGWFIEKYGFGELTFYIKNDKIMCDDETIGKERIRAVLNYIADNVICTGK